ncbi:SfnB family sulfur acquisition oxidoreductase [Acinetobacter gerneri]|jgi:SfnB family sulfur acquisition oxidoreductase|uniref:Dibenzothiophene monooxygenase n=1 Tax=Acinetobacter gerneri TaxID=202952 RepID=A0AAW8JDC1_9GAMM|nr:SfnB family sulfur acquisition oxidoreductase [Acinetobacter gerneri]MCH4244139.1 SfnB family sulfur acquisition oxidoreductase [Acinetobacter gerneri]MDQ9008469.1 SfnB family sulfur acquisition oxidoreductase [Acinetobacter gerneri]MDQ9012566.1 SfnB family sulfur acquisition oxidoreductase [Acinetobacter gerneri]MDQ9024001.1 SfnB family sulfur acquisition oxidoreductase [Acinetobacter gerneri]MDQ9051037.1 SfnB family sulfur acquisition oxidoreductase [Acinetobacter gerneri]
MGNLEQGYQNLSKDKAIPLSVFEIEQNAHVIKTDAEAIDIAKKLAEEFAKEASLRDQERRLPLDEIKQYSQSGLWAINIPRAYGGADVSYKTLAEVVKTISSVDSSLGQIAQNHWAFIEHIRLDATEEQKKFFFDLILKGIRFGNAFSEKTGKTVADLKTTLTKTEQGYVINGTKFFATGALLAHWVPAVAVNAEGQPHVALIPRDTLGLNIINDWSGFGQRTTASGTVELNNVAVREEYIIPIYKAFERPTPAGAISQFIQAAVDAGIARGAIAETIQYVQQKARAWVDSGQEKASEDPFTIANIGELKIKLRAAEAVLDLAGEAIDQAIELSSDENVSNATLLVAESKVLTTEIALLASNKLFELSGTRSTLSELNLDRHWRNARTHTLHDPVRWKYHIIGNYYLNGVEPPRHAWS